MDSRCTGGRVGDGISDGEGVRYERNNKSPMAPEFSPRASGRMECRERARDRVPSGVCCTHDDWEDLLEVRSR